MAADHYLIYKVIVIGEVRKHDEYVRIYCLYNYINKLIRYTNRGRLTANCKV